MRSLRRALLWASVAGIWVGCSVNKAGLGDGSVLTGNPTSGAGGGAGNAVVAGHGGATGAGGAGGSIPTGIGGASSKGGAAGGGSAGVSGVAGMSGSAGTSGGGAGGDATGTGGGGSAVSGTAGSTGGTDSSGAAGTGDAGSGGGSEGGATGSGGVGGDAGGSGGAGGASGGRGGGGGIFGGRGGRGGGNVGGRGGGGGNPCATYPAGTKAFVNPTDGLTHCYWARSMSQTWSQSQQSCMMQNGHLVTITSAEENAFVVSMAPFSGSFDDTWIGATDDKAGTDKTGPGTYHWVTNEPWTYSNWEQGQPDGFCDPCSFGQTCTCDHRAVLASDGTWNDRWQDNTRSSVCEATP